MDRKRQYWGNGKISFLPQSISMLVDKAPDNNKQITESIIQKWRRDCHRDESDYPRLKDK